MVATELNRLPSFKSRRTLSPLENEPRERKSNPEKNLSSDREPSANSGLDIETENFSATGGGRSFFVDIPFYRTIYLRTRLLVGSGFLDTYADWSISARRPIVVSDITIRVLNYWVAAFALSFPTSC